MSNKRMFNKTIIESDAFLDMPLSTQGLYFHLSMNADDYGFVSPKRIMRMIGANDDDLKILYAKRFILGFESGVAVVKHWKINNTIRADRATMTTYEKEYETLTFNEYGAYTETSRVADLASSFNNTTPKVVENSTKPETVTEENDTLPAGLTQKDGQMTAQFSLVKFRLGKVSILESKLSNKGDDAPVKTKTPSVDIDEMFQYWEQTIGYRIDGRIKHNRYACSNLLKKHTKDGLMRLIDGVLLAKADRYAPNIADFTQLQSKFNELISWGQRQKNKSMVGVVQ